MRVVQAVIFSITVCFSILFGFSIRAWAVNTVQLTGIAVDEPLAMIVEIDGEGKLARDGATYEHINKAGLGFKKGDIFEIPDNDPTKEEYVVILLNKGTDPSKVSLVRIMEGGRIVFLDDDGNFAITGVYIESTDPNEPSSFVFDIEHASTSRPFLVWTPDLVVGVRGTFFEVRPGARNADYATWVVGYNELEGAETSDPQLVPADLQWDPNDVVVYLLDWDKLKNALLSANVTTAPAIGDISSKPVSSLNPACSPCEAQLAFLAMNNMPQEVEGAFSDIPSDDNTFTTPPFAKELSVASTGVGKDELGTCITCSLPEGLKSLVSQGLSVIMPHTGPNTQPEDLDLYVDYEVTVDKITLDFRIVIGDSDDEGDGEDDDDYDNDDDDDDNIAGTQYKLGHMHSVTIPILLLPDLAINVDWATPESLDAIVKDTLVRLLKPGKIFGAYTRNGKFFVFERDVKSTDDLPKKGKGFFKEKKKKVKKKKAKRHHHGHKVEVAVEAL